VLVFTSAIWFARRDMMSDDFWFRGFPAAWNLVAPVMFLLNAQAQRLVTVLSAVPRNLAIVVKQIGDQKSGEAA